jgi:Family of unknown function (DUF6090)
MEEELTKHTKKIYHTIKNPGHSFLEKLKEVAIEIFIIVFAVTLSIWLHNWSDHRLEQKETEEFLRGLKNDLAKDIELLKENKNAIARVDSGFNFIVALNNNKAIDTASGKLISDHLNLEACTTHPNIGRYEGFKSSGKIGTIENDSLKQSVLVYYQQTIPNLDDMETLVNAFQMNILNVEVDRNDKMSLAAVAKTHKMRALLQLGTQNMEGELRAYDEAQQQAKEIILMIDRQHQHHED